MLWGLLILLSACGSDERPVNAGGGNGKVSTLTVQGVVVEAATITDTYNTTGSIRANEMAEVRSETAGRITQINFKEGSYVNKGQLLIQVEKDELEAQLKKIEVEMKLAEQTKTRTERLYEIEGISKEALDQSVSSYESLNADKALVEAQLAKRRIVAPFSGYIGLREVSLGTYLAPSDLITTIQDDASVKIDFTIPEQYVYRLGENQEILFKPNGMNEYFPAKIYSRSNTIDPMSRTLMVRAITNNKGKKFRVGSFAEIRINFSKIEDAITIPAQSLIPQIEGYSVFLAKGGKTVSQAVEIGVRTESIVQITEGLSLGDTVITTGILGMKNGMNVAIKLADSEVVNTLGVEPAIDSSEVKSTVE